METQASLRAENQMVKLGRMYRILSQTNQAMVRISDTRELSEEVCRLAAVLGPFETVRIVANSQQELNIVASSKASRVPPLAWEKLVLKTGQPLLSQDGTSEAEFLAQWGSAASFPLWVEGELWGFLSFFCREGHFFSTEVSALLQETARDLAFGLETRILESRKKETSVLLSEMTSLVPGAFYKLCWQPDKGARFLYVSLGIDLLLPWSPTEVLDNAELVFRAIHPDDRQRFDQAVARSRDFLTVINLEFRLVRPNGTEAWVLATAFPQKIDGSVVWTGLAIDVTPQNKLQQTLRRERELLSVILDNIGDGVVAVDGEGHLTLVNQTAARQLEGSPTVDETRHWTSLDPALPWEAGHRPNPWFRRQKDGTLIHLETYVTDLAGQELGHGGRVLWLRDVTERDRIDERLRQSEKLESVGLLAGGIAHDFNNVMTGVFGFIQLAKMNADQADQVVQYLDLAQGPFQKARTLTQQLMIFSKGAELSKTAVSVSSVVQGILRTLSSDGSVVCEIRGPDAPWPVAANEAQVYQVFENLLLNTRQALAPGSEGRVTVNLANLAAPGPVGRGLLPRAYVEIELQDNGTGIPTEILPKVFDPFFTTKTNGTGLGLSICYSVVKKHGGMIEVESVPGQGTLVRIFWPAFTPLKET